MGQASIENRTPFAFEALYLLDEEARSLLVPVIKATYLFSPEGVLSLAPRQLPVLPSGQSWGKPGESSYRFEPECAFIKLATDVALIGNAHAPTSNTREMNVSFQVGPVGKVVRVVGHRTWFKSLGSIYKTEPLPFETIPLRYEHAFGGWDRTNPEKPLSDPRNPVGLGYRANRNHFEEELRLPNLEDPQQPIERFGQQVPPACFGFTSPHWQPRAAYGGTFDETWSKERMPLLPKNFDRRYFSAASPGLLAPGYLKGDALVTVIGATPEGRVSFRLPALTSPVIRVERRGDVDAQIKTNLDTIVVDADHRRLILIWRGLLALRDGPYDVGTLEITDPGAPPSLPPRVNQ